MNTWKNLDARLIDKPIRKQKNHGPRLEVSLSPYDIPEAFRGYYDEKNERFVLEFRYISSEDTRRLNPEDLYSVLLGKNSGRLYKIEIDPNKVGSGELTIELAFDGVINAIEQGMEGWCPLGSRNLNFKNKRLLETYKGDLVSELTSSKRRKAHINEIEYA